MFTIIGGDGKEYGPATIEQIQGWINAGRANLETQARRAGEEAWHRLGDFPEFNPAAGAAMPPPVGTAAPAPTPAPAPVYTDAKACAADLIARTGKLDIGACLERAFSLYTSNFWPLVGVTLLVTVVMTVIGFIPFIGSLASALLKGVFLGGLSYYYIGRLRSQPRELGDAFAGFSQQFGRLMLAGVLVTAVVIAVILVTMGPLVASAIHMAIAAQNHGTPPDFHMSAFGGIGLFVGMLVLLYLGVSWLFAFPLVIDKGLGAWTAMEVSRRVISRQWFRVFFVALIGGILTMLGIIALFIGLIFTLPLYYAAVYSAYETLCNPPPKA